MEKVEGAWKIVNSSVQKYKPWFFDSIFPAI
jgi:hypothetical protein